MNSLGCAHREDGERFVVRADEKLTVIYPACMGDSSLTQKGAADISPSQKRVEIGN
jgi:hypothetical protein